MSSHIRDQSSSALAKLAALASLQHGVISRAQLLRCGISPSTIHRWAVGGHLHSVYRGVYAVGHPSITREGRYLAAVLACGVGAALSHMSAARHLGLDRTRTAGTIHVSIPQSARRRPRGILVHRPRSMEPIDLTSRDRIPTMSATRTLFDLTPTLSAKELRVRFERAEYLEILDRGRLSRLLAGASGHGRIANLALSPTIRHYR